MFGRKNRQQDEASAWTVDDTLLTSARLMEASGAQRTAVRDYLAGEGSEWATGMLATLEEAWGES